MLLQSIVRYAAASLVACGMFATPVFSQNLETTVKVGQLPSVMLSFDGRIHIFCSRVDADFDNQKDSGDVSSSWVVLSAESNEVVQTTEFSWEDGYRFGAPVTLDSVRRIIYIPFSSGIRAYSLDNFDEIESSLVMYQPKISANAVAFAPDSTVAYLQSPSFSDPGYIVLTKKIPVGVSPTFTGYFKTAADKEGFWVVSQGTFGAPNADIRLIVEGEEEQQLTLGNTPNDVIRVGDSLIITMNGDDAVLVVSLDTLAIRKNIAVGAGKGFGEGPRASVVSGDTLYVACWGTNDVRVFSLSTGEFITSLDQDGKPSALAIGNEKLFVGRQYSEEGFTPDDDVLVWSLKAVSVLDATSGKQARASLFVYPQPATERIRLRLEVQQNYSTVKAELVSLQGEVLMESAVSHVAERTLQAEFPIAQTAVASGVYLIRILADGEQFSMPVQIQR